ncbi:MAG: NADH pyrophosphatase, partial [Pseudomonadota bacterium]
VRWFTRDEARQLIAGGFDGCFAPPAMAIAHQLVKSWSEE